MSPPEEASVPTKREQIAEAIEREIERLKQVRPGLEPRIDRATHILVAHLANPRSGTIRVRVGVGGPRFLVRSASSSGRVYEVDPSNWSCSCPDWHRRNGAACKHCVSCYVLWRAATVPKGCPVCHQGIVYLTVEEDGQERTEPVPCRCCSPRSQKEESG